MQADKSKPEDLAAGRVLRRLRGELGLTQADVGQRIGLSYQQVQKYESGANRMSISVLFQIAAVLQISPSDMVLAVENEMKGSKPGESASAHVADLDG